MKRFVILGIAAATIVGCTGKKNAVVTEDKGVLTKSAVAEEATVRLTEVFTSEIEPYKENDITPAASGVHIDKIMVEVGDPVREGQLIVSLDPTQYTQQLVQLKTVEDDYNRLLPVYEAGGISAQQIEQAKAQLDVQREVVANLKKNIEVRSPISGVVTARNYESGDLFAQQPILHIMQIDPLKVIANISEQYFPNVKVGMPVKLTVDIFPDEEFTGTVSLIYPALDPTTRTFKVEVKVPNAKRTLRPGMYARTTFDMGSKQGVMVPDVAIQKQVGSAERYLYVIVGDSVAARRSVEVGRQIGGSVDILRGVEPGEQVAVTALSKLFDGAKVEVKKD
ncbi:efflux RND transporter periplasmic adaptor subunit [Alistipes sp. kh20]|uniref:efflux RND transporter periplasmic adaptor subunit n=1 Tax=Alistipes TaxID=239759 RepID=UPI001898CF9F|nr:MULTISPECIES: efflux RND transporter periplasmic adaptor subunit [Alistipes]MBS4766239.1 efflux RND transporter periplasmic adaptor subunit [Alistipes montrealensis]